MRPFGQRRVVRDDDQRGAVGVDAVEQRGNLFARRAIEFACRFVREQQPRTVGERARNRDALHLAARQLRRPMVGARGEADVFEQLSVRVRRRAFGAAGLRQRQLDVLAAVSIGSRKNRWKTKPICRSRSRLRCRSDSAVTSFPLEEQRPGRWRFHAAKHVQQRRLAAPGRAADREVVARGDAQRDVAHRRDGPAGIGKTRDVECHIDDGPLIR